MLHVSTFSEAEEVRTQEMSASVSVHYVYVFEIGELDKSLVCDRGDRIYSDSIRIRIFFLESRIFGFGFENFGDRIIFEYSNLFPRISNI